MRIKRLEMMSGLAQEFCERFANQRSQKLVALFNIAHQL